MTVPAPWNVNIHYDGTLGALVPSTARSVLDVGCGDGFLAASLARRVSHVVALDLDQPVLDRAQARFPDVPVTWLHGDVLADVVPPGSFDAVVSNATLYHLPDTRTGLRRLSTLIRPGGVLAIVTFARTELARAPVGVGRLHRSRSGHQGARKVGAQCADGVAPRRHIPSATCGCQDRAARRSRLPPGPRQSTDPLASPDVRR